MRKRVIARKRLFAKRAEEVRELAAALNRSGTLSPSMTVEDGMGSLPHFFLGYEGGRLAAYAEWFYDGTRFLEILLFVHPACQRQGWMNALLSEFWATFSAEPRLAAARPLFVCEPEDETLRRALRHMGAVKVRSDYLLELTFSGALFRALPEGVTPVWREDGSVTELTLYRKGQKAGQARLFTEERQVFLFDVWVAPGCRRQGLGRYLAEELGKRRGTRPLLLHVDSGRRAALALYRSLGCRIREQRDFFGGIGENGSKQN